MLQNPGAERKKNRVSWNEEEIVRIHEISPRPNRNSNFPNLPPSVLERNKRSNKTQNEMPMMPQTPRKQVSNFYPDVAGRELQLVDDDDNDDEDNSYGIGYLKPEFKPEQLFGNDEYQQNDPPQQQSFSNQTDQFPSSAQFNHVPPFESNNQVSYNCDKEDMDQNTPNNAQSDSDNYQQQRTQSPNYDQQRNYQNPFEAPISNGHFQPNHQLREEYQTRFEPPSSPASNYQPNRDLHQQHHQNRFESSSTSNYQPNRDLQQHHQNHFETVNNQWNSNQDRTSLYDSTFADSSGDKFREHPFNAQSSSTTQKRKHFESIGNYYESDQQKRRFVPTQSSSFQSENSFPQADRMSNGPKLQDNNDIQSVMLKRIEELGTEKGQLSVTLENERSAWKRKFEEFEEKLRQANQRIKELEADAQKVSIEREKEAREMDKKKREIQSLEQRLKNKINEANEANATLKSFSDAKERADSLKSNAERSYMEALADVDKYRNKASDYKKEKDQLKSDLKEEKKNHKLAQEQIEKLKQEISTLTANAMTQATPTTTESSPSSTVDQPVQSPSNVKIEDLSSK